MAIGKTLSANKKMDDESPRRMAPQKAPPLSVNGIRYEVVLRAHLRGFKQSAGVIAAIEEKTGQEKWIVQVYQTYFDNDEEKDVQNVYITKIELDKKGQGLIISNERGEKYTINFEGGNIVKID